MLVREHGRLLEGCALRGRPVDDAGDAHLELSPLRVGLDDGLEARDRDPDRLARLGAIEPTRTEPRRGAVEHYYRATGRATVSDYVDHIEYIAKRNAGTKQLAPNRADRFSQYPVDLCWC